MSEAEHPLLCEGTRREKGDLALALMITYKDDQSKLKKVAHQLRGKEESLFGPRRLGVSRRPPGWEIFTARDIVD